MQRLYLEDLAVGQRFESRRELVDPEAIKAFAREFDPQPFHLDEEGAKLSLFGGLSASGWHTAALTMRLIVESVPLQGGVIGLGGELSWPRPTRAGDTCASSPRCCRSHPPNRSPSAAPSSCARRR